MDVVALIPAVMFCSTVTGQCGMVYGERVEPVFELCETQMVKIDAEAERLESIGKLPGGLYLVHRECIAVFK
jgi:hypothetical protein